MVSPDPSQHLTAAQRRAATFGLSPGVPARPGQALLVVAGAGTGKTTTLAHRVAQLVLHGADPARLLLLTFTRRAAEEMRGRAEAILAAHGRRLSGPSLELGWAGTFHGVAARLLREYAERIGLDPGFTILDRATAEDVLDLVRADLGLDRGPRRFPTKATCLAAYSRAVNTDLPLGSVLARDFPWLLSVADPLAELCAAYVAAKQRQALLDFDDLLLWWAEMLAAPTFAAEVGARFDFVLVDEFQDTNPLQARILQRLKPGGQGVTVIGDDAQAIFAFRGATVRNIRDFPGACEPPAAIVTLEDNHRSTQPILDLANAILRQSARGYRKTLRSSRISRQRPWLVVVRDEAAQAAYVAEQVLATREAGVPLRDQAVLARTATHTARLEVELARRGIPFVKYGGLRFLEAAHVRDVLALLRFLENPRDRVSGLRLLKLLPGIGPTFARRALDAVAARGGDIAALAALTPPMAAAQLWGELLDLAAAEARWPGQLGDARAFYERLMFELYGPAPDRLLDLDQLEAMAALHATRRAFLDEVGLDPPAAHGDLAGAPHKDDDYLVLSTIHSAKGREWRAVYLIYVLDGWIPSDLAAGRGDELEEERRLLYVAITRARDELHLVQPLRVWLRPQGTSSDRWVAAARSRFLPADVLHLLDARAWPPPTASGTERGGTTVDVAEAIRTRWR
jgi:DNA helicase-2/ATP-dependent DNA helicase PcrA